MEPKLSSAFCGFIEGKGTNFALFIITETVRSCTDQPRVCGMVLMGLLKVYDY